MSSDHVCVSTLLTRFPLLLRSPTSSRAFSLQSCRCTSPPPSNHMRGSDHASTVERLLRDLPPTNAFQEPPRRYKTDHQPQERAETPSHPHPPTCSTRPLTLSLTPAPLLYLIFLFVPCAFKCWPSNPTAFQCVRP